MYRFPPHLLFLNLSHKESSEVRETEAGRVPLRYRFSYEAQWLVIPRRARPGLAGLGPHIP